MKISVIIRTLNEEKYLEQLLKCIKLQDFNETQFEEEVEIVLVDSGSTDNTLIIAKKFGCSIIHINREDFSFGRSLNLGCKFSSGDILVFVSGHCVPVGCLWLQKLCAPLISKNIKYVYGKQIGGPETKLSESRIFLKYFSDISAIPQKNIFCNNANSAILASTWSEYQFNEELTGLEDMYMAKEIIGGGGSIGYVSNAVVIHHHNESWGKVRKRFEREALALREIMPQVHISKLDVFRYIFFSILSDSFWAIKNGIFIKNFIGILFYRYNQFIGSYLGNKIHRKLSKVEKERYFFPG